MIEWTQTLLERPGRTLEFYLCGTRLIMTNDCENVKAIMSTQVRIQFFNSIFVSAFFVIVDGTFSLMRASFCSSQITGRDTSSMKYFLALWENLSLPVRPVFSLNYV